MVTFFFEGNCLRFGKNMVALFLRRLFEAPYKHGGLFLRQLFVA
jgi:hypothetical protein